MKRITTGLLVPEFGLGIAVIRMQMSILMLVAVDEKRWWRVGLTEFPDTRVRSMQLAL